MKNICIIILFAVACSFGDVEQKIIPVLYKKWGGVPTLFMVKLSIKFRERIEHRRHERVRELYKQKYGYYPEEYNYQ